MALREQQIPSLLHNCEASWPILICVLGNFLVLKEGQAVTLRRGGKAETLLCHLGIHYGKTVPRDRLLNMLWPTSDAALAIQSLNSLIHSLRKLVGAAIDGAMPVLH